MGVEFKCVWLHCHLSLFRQHELALAAVIFVDNICGADEAGGIEQKEGRETAPM